MMYRDPIPRINYSGAWVAKDTIILFPYIKMPDYMTIISTAQLIQELFKSMQINTYKVGVWKYEITISCFGVFFTIF